MSAKRFCDACSKPASVDVFNADVGIPHILVSVGILGGYDGELKVQTPPPDLCSWCWAKAVAAAGVDAAKWLEMHP